MPNLLSKALTDSPILFVKPDLILPGTGAILSYISRALFPNLGKVVPTSRNLSPKLPAALFMPLLTALKAELVLDKPIVNSLKELPTVLSTPTIGEKALTNLPPISITGPTAASSPPIFATIDAIDFLVDWSKSYQPVAKSLNAFTTSLILGANIENISRAILPIVFPNILK